ncbi:MAG: hypothetical protein J5527_13675 [Treponema sp.]|nr:hypothetical protein [Treponema sp.]
MEETQNFIERLESAILKKKEWFDSVQLPAALEQYRLMLVCVKTVNENLVKRSIITPDPYKWDKRISEVVVPPADAFTDQDFSQVLGERLSSYETMIDFVCNYYRFNVDSLPVTKVKLLVDLNKCFQWDNLTTANGNPNTQGLATAIQRVKTNAPNMTLSMINDSVDKCSKAYGFIAKTLSEFAGFQREYYKWSVRKEVIGSSDFDKSKASSKESECAEIKRLFQKIMGKKPFYADLISEIAEEDLGDDKTRLQEMVLAKLALKQTDAKPKPKGPTSKEILMGSVQALGGIAPVLTQLDVKLTENFDLLFFVKKTFFRKIMQALRKAMGLSEKERTCTIPVVDQKTGVKVMQKIKVNEMLTDLDNKKRIYSGIAAKGIEYAKIEGASETAILTFVNKQISENQALFTTINALDDYFKANVEVLLRPKVKGLKIDLSSYRNAIINVNKKRGEYVSIKEEVSQMRQLGINGKI